MESRVNWIRSSVWHGIPCQFHDGTFHVKCSIFDVSWGISIWHGIPWQIDATAHIQFCHGAPCQIWHGFHVKNGLTRNSMSKGLSERTGTILHRFHTGSPFKGCFQRFGMGEQAFTFLCVSLIFAQNDLRNENKHRTHNNDNEKRKQHMETEKLTISTSKQTGHNKATHW